MSTNRDQILAYILGAGGVGPCFGFSYWLYLEWRDGDHRRQRNEQQRLKRSELRRMGGR